MTIIKTDLDGQEREFEVLKPENGNKFATHRLFDGQLLTARANDFGTLLRLISPRHYFGGVVFEETGEVRQAEPGEWRLESGNFPVFHPNHVSTYEILFSHPMVSGKYPILRPAALEVDDGS